MNDRPIEILDRTDTIDVETVSANGTVHRVPIWVVVVEGAAYVASVAGTKGRWYQELLARHGTLIAGAHRIPVRAVPVEETRLRELVSAAYGAKYPNSGSGLTSMQRPEVLATTLRLEVTT